jgi:hypothetical protein
MNDAGGHVKLGNCDSQGDQRKRADSANGSRYFKEMIANQAKKLARQAIFVQRRFLDCRNREG